MLALRTRGRGSRGRWLYGSEAGHVDLRNLGRCTFTRDNGEQEGLRAQQERKIIQEETTTDPGWGGVGAAGGQMGLWPLTWAESWLFAGEEVCPAVGTVDDLQCGAWVCERGWAGG